MKNKILADIFSNNMVLQRNKAVRFFGTTNAATPIRLSFNGIVKDTISSDDGNWEIVFPPMKEAENLTLEVCNGEQTIILSNIAIGEVWLAGGQSNMEFELSRCTDWERIRQNKDKRIRFFYTPKLPYVNEDYYTAFEKAKWETIEDATMNAWSAVGYLFAEELAKKLNCVIGIIGCNWGGTSASCWMSREAILEDKDTSVYWTEYYDKIKDLSFQEQKEAYDKYTSYHSVWEEKCNKMYADNPNTLWDDIIKECGECQWPGPINVCNPFRPAGLYEQMIKKICPYTLRGFIYYQGENDDFRPRMYYKLFTRLIRQWRDDWEDDALAFMLCQLPMHRYAADKDFKNWPLIREAQMKTFNTIKNTGIAIFPDASQFNEIHPQNKGPVGLRLALQALYHTYKLAPESNAFGPMYSYMIIQNNSIQLFFNYAENGLKLNEMQDKNFEIAGEDKIFYPANKVSINGASVIISSDKVHAPVFARYCWTNYCIPCLFGTNGIPAAPFRTSINDEIDLNIDSASIQQNLEI